MLNGYCANVKWLLDYIAAGTGYPDCGRDRARVVIAPAFS
jgi:hypothetical protein